MAKVLALAERVASAAHVDHLRPEPGRRHGTEERCGKLMNFDVILLDFERYVILLVFFWTFG